MRARRPARRAPLVVLLLALLAGPAAAQEPATEGALFLLLPIGARAVGMGQAIVSTQPGSESVWWNPAALARAEKREAAIHHSQTIVATGDAVSFVLPSAVFGVIALSANILNFGEQQVTDTGGAQGSLVPRNLVYAASYATTIGARTSAGVSYKIIQLRLDCSGGCAGVPAVSAASSALDAGVQYNLAPLLPIALGLAVRNVGPRLQVNDREQADPLPSRAQIGVTYRTKLPDRVARGVEATVGSDIVSDLRLSRRSTRIGAELEWERRVHLRGGYVFDSFEGAGPALGFGVTSNRFAVDIARVFRGLSADLGQAPTYVSLRYLF